jgi:hypothetical protein
MKSIFLTILILLSILSPLNCLAFPPNSIETRGLQDILLPRKPINLSKLGLNAFVNDTQFGSIKSQLAEVKSRLGVKYIRILFAWNDDVQATRSSAINYSFYDDIAKSIPTGVSALVILTGMPT